MTVKVWYFYYVYEDGWPKNDGVRRWQVSTWEEAKARAQELQGEAEREQFDTESGVQTYTFCDAQGRESQPVQGAQGLRRRERVMAALRKRAMG